MKNSPSPPPAPDPTATANAQSGANIQTAIANARLNRVNQQTPWGSITYSQGTPDANGVPTWSSSIQLSPAQQQLLEMNQGQQLGRGQLANQFLDQISTQPLDFADLPGVDNRGHIWSGMPQHASQGQQGGQGGHGGVQGNGIDMNQIMAALQQAMPQGGQPPGAQQGQPSQQPPTVPGQPQGQPGMPSAPATSAPFQLTYQDYLQNAPGLNASENATPPMTEAQWNAMPPDQQWQLLGFGSQGINVRPGDNRYGGLKDVVGGEQNRSVNVMPGSFTSNVNDHGVPRFNDPKQVHQGPGYYASSDDNTTAAAQRLGGMSDLQWALYVASLFGGGALAGGMGTTGADMLAAAPGEGFGTAGLGAGSAGMGASGLGLGAGDADQALANQTVANGGVMGAPPNYAPVTDLSTRATQPSLWRQALTNLQSGKGLLGMNSTGTRVGAALLPSILRGLSGSRTSQGGSQ